MNDAGLARDAFESRAGNRRNSNPIVGTMYLTIDIATVVITQK
jgi:hypothetical protein